MNISFYRKESRSTWAETFFGDAHLSHYKGVTSSIAESLDRSLDNLKKHLFYGSDDALPASEERSDFDDLDLSRGQKDLLHAILGIATESGELLESIKPLLDNDDNGDLDLVNIDEEMGDIYYYMMRMHDVLETEPGDTMDRNLSKLLERYEEGEFDPESALNRDTDQEREALES